MHSTSQYVHVSLVMGGIEARIFSIHASCNASLKQSLWTDFTDFNTVSPWLVAGDFNAVTCQEEKIGGRPISFQDTGDFNNMISQTGLIDTGLSGNKFTWSNNRMGKSRILE